MSIKKIVLIALIALVLVGVYTIPANAAFSWYTATVVQMGPSSNGSVYVKLTDTAATPAFTNMWFKVYPDQVNRMMAVVLTAMTNSMQLNVLVDKEKATPDLRLVMNMYLFAN